MTWRKYFTCPLSLIAGFMDEIRLLEGLRGRDNIIQLVDAEVCKAEGLIYVVGPHD